MGRRKKEEDIIIRPNEPFMKCFDCVKWIRKRHPNNPDAVDLSSGCCVHNGYSSVPPMFTCNGWESSEGYIIDKMQKVTEQKEN